MLAIKQESKLASKGASLPAFALLSQKGGAGKTTLAVHLAVAAGDALIIDTDKQKSATGWWRERDGELPELVTSTAQSVPKALVSTKRKWVFIDTPPRHEEALQAVCAVSDFILIPARPGILDLRAIADTVGLVDGKSAVIVLNSCPPGKGFGEASVVSEARQALSVYGLPVCPVTVSQRVAFSHALNGGLAVTEFEPEGKAAREIRRLWEWLACQNASR
jgi:chromosome partitioning protein